MGIAANKPSGHASDEVIIKDPDGNSIALAQRLAVALA